MKMVKRSLILVGAALVVMASAEAQENQEKLSDRVFTVKDKSGAPLLQITNVRHVGSFVTVTVTNVSGRRERRWSKAT